MSTELKPAGDKDRIELEIARTKAALRPSTLLVVEPKQDISKNFWVLEYMGSSIGLPFFIRCFYLVGKLCWLYMKKTLLQMTHRARSV